MRILIIWVFVKTTQPFLRDGDKRYRNAAKEVVMKSGGQARALKQFMWRYNSDRSVLCRERRRGPWEIKRPDKNDSKCARELYRSMWGVWKKLTTSNGQKRFSFRTASAVSGKVESMCLKYSVKRGSWRSKAEKKAYISCTTAAVKGDIAWLKKQFKAVGLKKFKPYLSIKRDNGTYGDYTFKAALFFLSVPRCGDDGIPNTLSVYPRCDKI